MGVVTKSVWNKKVLHNPVERCPCKEYYHMLEEHMTDFLQPSPPEPQNYLLWNVTVH